MNKTSVLKTLKAQGTAQQRKVYARHGFDSPMFGVSYANLGTLKKEINTDHKLAEALWATGNFDARVLATMIADPQALTAKTVDAWVKDLSNYAITGAVAVLVRQSPLGLKRMDKWMKSENEWICSLGWGVLGGLSSNEDLPDAFFAPYLKTIEANIHASQNRVRYNMNMAVIAIGVRSAALHKTAAATARRIGTVMVDHGNTACKTPDAVSYMAKTVAHRAKQAAARQTEKAARRNTRTTSAA